MNVENVMPKTIVDRKYLGFISDIKQCERHNIYMSRSHGKKFYNLLLPVPILKLVSCALLLHNVLVSKVV